MHPVILILIMIGIGAFIGGLTNSLAIKMLFRPYKALYIGKFRLPFTPGLIPKRQKELAQQLGKMVVNHLLTPEGIRRKLTHSKFQEQMTGWAKAEVTKMLQQEKTVSDLLTVFHVEVTSDMLKQNIAEWVEERYHDVMTNYREVRLEDLLTTQWKNRIDDGVDQSADYIQQSIVAYFHSTEGREKVSALIENYLDNQGFLGNMISSFMGPEGLTERVYPILLKYVSDREMNEWLKSLLHSEKNKWMDQPLSYIEDMIGSQTIGKTLGQAVSNYLPVEQWTKKTIAEWSEPFQEKISEHVVPALVEKSIVLLSSKIEHMMDTFRLAEVVQEEVESFQVERLEEMVLGISRREFKMITYLGALLGGIIGLLQAMIVLFFG
ncbi:DUF445 domain-containing protein [Halobacillus litoralis]|uniref:DUF445 domain-containing protein n=1 Tax=Halobacillus litoralis TaxID=45668 RepID=UPI001CFF1218|nr:DUF445 family protein [Halobacillus litoralis]